MPEYILVDFQTTGTVAASSSIIEAGWAIFSDEADELIDSVNVSLIRLPNGQRLSAAIRKLTGIREEQYEEAGDVLTLSPDEMQARLAAFLRARPNARILVHYATFKVPFLKKALADQPDLLEGIDSRVICTHRLAKTILPQLKSHSLRAVAGFAGYSADEKKRALDHLKATAHVWKFLQKSQEALDASRSLDNPVDPDFGPRIARAKRLALPSRPGIYFFRDNQGRVLYVGKASNLKQRVNSYFRGQKTKGSRLNEMLTRASELDVIECRSELEALLRESDAIKEHDPPYNRLLRMEDRSLVFFTTELLFGIREGGRFWGPVTSPWLLQFLSALMRGESPIAGLPGLTTEKLQEGLEHLFESIERVRQPEAWKALALKIWDEAREEDEDVAADDEDLDAGMPETEPFETVEDVAEFLKGCILQLLRSMKRGRWMLRLMYADVEWMKTGAVLALRGTSYQLADRAEDCPEPSYPSYRQRMQSMDLAVLDRTSIVLSQLKRAVEKREDLRLRLGPGLVLAGDDIARFLG